MEKMAIWNMVSETDPKYTSRVTQRGGFTAIDAYYQIRQATELWGPYGSAWGLQNMKRTLVMEMEMAFLDAEFFYPDGDKTAAFQIANSIDLKTRSNKNGDNWDDEFVKKLETNTISKSLSRLGFGADVFMGLFDDARYVSEKNQKFGNPQPEPPKMPGLPGVPPPIGKPPAPETAPIRQIQNSIQFFSKALAEQQLRPAGMPPAPPPPPKR